MTLEEEYENQESWRESHDKLTFILCQPVAADAAAVVDGDENERAEASVEAGEVDVPDKMIGDINFFIYPFDGDDDEEEEAVEERVRSGDAPTAAPSTSVIGEIDIMIASHADRGKGLGKAAVSAFLHYIWTHRDVILDEYDDDNKLAHDEHDEDKPKSASAAAASTRPRLRMLMAKIKATNERSIALFRGLGFVQEGEVNYFGEVKLVMRGLDGGVQVARPPGGYEVVRYRRPGE